MKLQYSREILELLKQVGLYLNLQKCRFGMEKVEYLKYIISNGDIRPGERKIRAIEDFFVPNDEHGVRRFIGTASFFSRFVPEFDKIVRS